MTSTLQHEIQMRPDFSMLKVSLEQGQKVHAEPSAMAAIADRIAIKSGANQGSPRPPHQGGFYFAETEHFHSCHM
jgi:uncharacterized protein (AIM24 family)